MARANYVIDEQIYEYLMQISVKEPPVLEVLREKTRQMPGWGKILSPECGHFLRFLLRLIGAKRCLDVGTFTGFSALSMAVTIPWDGEVHTCELDENRLNWAKNFFDLVEEKAPIITHLGLAADSLKQLLREKGPGYFDFMFMDADKVSNEIYYQLALQLVRKNGLIAVDNIFWYKQILDTACQDEETQAVRRFNLARSILADGLMTTIPMGDGLMLIQLSDSLINRKSDY